MIAVARRRHGALAEIYKRHGGVVHEVAEHLCGGSCADELVRRIFLDVWQTPEDFGGNQESLRASLLTRTHRLAVDALRDNSAHRRGEYAATSSDRAWPLLSQLPAAEHTAIWLTYFVGYTAAEVARLLDQSEAKIKRRLGRGLRGLRLLANGRRRDASPRRSS